MSVNRLQTATHKKESMERLGGHLRTPLYRNGYALIFSAASSSLLGMLYWVFAARFYTIEVVGLNSAALITMSFLAGVSRLYLDGVLIRFLPRAGTAAARLITAAFLIGGVLAAAVAAVFLFGLDLWAPALGFLRATPWLSVGFVVATAATCIFVQQDGALVGLRETKWVPVENTFFAVVKLLLLVVLARPLPEYGIFVSWAVALVLLIFPLNLLIFRKLIPAHIRETNELQTTINTGEIVRYAGGLYFGELFSTASTRLLPLIVLQIAGSSAVAFFTVPMMIAQSLQLITPSMMNSLTVEASREEKNLIFYSRKALLQTARILIPVVAIIVLAAPYILLAFGRSYAQESTTLLRLLALATIPNMVIGLYLGIARVWRSTVRIVAVHITLFALVMGMSFLFLAEQRVSGVGVAVLISHTLVMLAILFGELRPLIWPTHLLQEDLSTGD